MESSLKLARRAPVSAFCLRSDVTRPARSDAAAAAAQCCPAARGARNDSLADYSVRRHFSTGGLAYAAFLFFLTTNRPNAYRNGSDSPHRRGVTSPPFNAECCWLRRLARRLSIVKGLLRTCPPSPLAHIYYGLSVEEN